MRSTPADLPRLSSLAGALLLLAALLVTATPAAAESECYGDAAGDVRDNAATAAGEGGVVLGDEPRIDILAGCVELTPEFVEIAVRVVDAVDPMEDPSWGAGEAAIGAAIDLGGDLSSEGNAVEEYTVNYGLLPEGEIGVAVYEFDPDMQGSGLPVCEGDGIYDGVRYRMRFPTSCIGDPAQISAAVFGLYGSDVDNQATTGFYDEVPIFPDYNGPYTPAPDPPTDVERLAGPARVDTAIAVSQDDFEAGTAGAVVLARADLFPDALVAAPLAVAVNGPLLLTPSFAVAQIVEDEIARVLPPGGTVYLSGGEAALSADVAAEIEALGYVVQRAAGPSRYATAVEVARASGPDPDLIVVANGNDFPEALVGGSLAAAEGGVEIISNGEQLDDTATAYLAEHPDAEVLAIGPVASAAVPDAASISGPDVFTTSVLVAQERYTDPTAAGIASGTNFPDGLTGGANAGRRGVPLLLSTPDLLPDSVDAYLDGLDLQTTVMYGGTVALAYQVEASVDANIGN
ncbi:cell wall-binding repeat-containing protein [Euzebya tangerina]|uniref:cell wall-binding repeat-containing protein n=1 Tax=Euzebya tangerina TaxID=591198 RepID=UPI000E31ACB2|nr:cell wall-binding repeat-containing protein [Euzebya tangerina]